MNFRGSAPFGHVERMLAIRYLAARREHGGLALISVVSVIGVSLAVFALIAIMSIMNGFRIELLSKIIGFEPHVEVGVRTLESDEVDALAGILSERQEVVSVEPMVSRQVLATGPRATQGVLLRGVRPEDARANALLSSSILEGSLEGWGTRTRGVALGARLAAGMGLGVGSTIRLVSPDGDSTVFGVTPRSRSYEVTALFGVGNERYDRYTVLMPLDEAVSFFSLPYGAERLGLRLRQPDKARAFGLKIARGVASERPVYDWQTTNRQYVTALEVERNVMRLIMMIVVMITALNIITGILMLVKNKTRDIAILRTIGVSRAGVVRIFLMSGSALGAAGVVAGLLAGVGFVLNISAIQHGLESLFGVELFPKSIYVLDAIPAKLQWSEVAFVTAWAFLMSVLTTLLPSLQAARLDPVEAFRNQ